MIQDGATGSVLFSTRIRHPSVICFWYYPGQHPDEVPPSITRSSCREPLTIGGDTPGPSRLAWAVDGFFNGEDLNLESKATIPFSCNKCHKSFLPPKGGICSSCGLVFCGAHISAWDLPDKELSLKIGDSICQDCRDQKDKRDIDA